MSLIPCDGCRRHVRSSEARCPFCDAVVTAAPRPALGPDARRLSRAALMVAASLAVAACGGGTPQPVDPGDGSEDGDADVVDSGPPDDGGTMTKYGGPPPPPEDSEPTPPPEGDDGTVHALYGVPAPQR